MNEIEKFLDKIPIDKIYEDLFQPGLKKAGEALSTVLDVSNSILLPFKLLNAKSKSIFTENMKRYEEKLENAGKRIAQVPEYVGIPILDKLTYLTEKNISEAFINLLAAASNEDTLKLVHPAFLSTLTDLSSDEAKILFALKDATEIPFIDVYLIKETEIIKKPSFADEKGPKSKEQLNAIAEYTFQDRMTTDIRIAWNLTAIPNEIELTFPNNIDLYLYNLERHKIIEYDRTVYKRPRISDYEKLENEIHKGSIDAANSVIKDSIEKGYDYTLKLSIRKGQIEFTDYGKCFLKACMNEIKKG
jgi:hypothetical protein